MVPRGSGGFQLVSLVKLSTMTEQGVQMQSPFHPDDPSQIILLSPEESMRIQHAIGADIMCISFVFETFCLF